MDIVRETGTFATGDVQLASHFIVLGLMMAVALVLMVVTTKMKTKQSL